MSVQVSSRNGIIPLFVVNGKSFSRSISCFATRHKNAEQRDVCKSTKWMMLHVRDCPGTTSTFDVCPFPWCRKVKHLLYHLVSCQEPDTCSICSPKDVNDNMAKLKGLNEHRLKQYRDKLVARMKATSAARAKALSAAKPGQPSAARAAMAKSQANKPSQFRQAAAAKASTTATTTTTTGVLPKTGNATAVVAAAKPVPPNPTPVIRQVKAATSSVTVKIEHAQNKQPSPHVNAQVSEAKNVTVPVASNPKPPAVAVVVSQDPTNTPSLGLPPKKVETSSREEIGSHPCAAVAARTEASSASPAVPVDAPTNKPSLGPPLKKVETSSREGMGSHPNPPAAAVMEASSASPTDPVEAPTNTPSLDPPLKKAETTPREEIGSNSNPPAAAGTDASFEFAPDPVEVPQLKIKVDLPASPSVPEESPTAPSPTLSPDGELKGVMSLKAMPDIKIEDDTDEVPAYLASADPTSELPGNDPKESSNVAAEKEESEYVNHNPPPPSTAEIQPPAASANGIDQGDISPTRTAEAATVISANIDSEGPKVEGRDMPAVSNVPGSSERLSQVQGTERACTVDSSDPTTQWTDQGGVCKTEHDLDTAIKLETLQNEPESGEPSGDPSDPQAAGLNNQVADTGDAVGPPPCQQGALSEREPTMQQSMSGSTQPCVETKQSTNAASTSIPPLDNDASQLSPSQDDKTALPDVGRALTAHSSGTDEPRADTVREAEEQRGESAANQGELNDDEVSV